jgi:hypothetical protein
MVPPPDSAAMAACDSIAHGGCGQFADPEVPLARWGPKATIVLSTPLMISRLGFVYAENTDHR